MPSPSGQDFSSNYAAVDARPARGVRVTGWILTILIVAFLLLDSASHFAVPKPVVDAFLRLSLPISLSVPLAVIALICALLYAIPQTSVLGVVLLTGYLGGAVAIQLRAGSPPFEAVFPFILGAIAWTGSYLREPRLRALIPFRS